MENLKQRAIQAAERFLYHRGYDIVDVGWKSPAGGIDIVARDDDALVFVEVAARDGASTGFPPSRNEGELRALVRHHINSLSVAEESLGGKEALTEVA